MPAIAIRQDIPVGELRRQARLEEDGRVAARLLAIAAVLDGHSRAHAARLGGMDRQTLRDWVHRFNAEGVAGLRDRPRSGRPRLLAAELRPELAALIADGPDLERDGVVEYRLAHIQELAKRHFGADYSRGGMHGVLQQMGLSWQTPRPIHPKTDPAAQEAFKKTSPPSSPPSPSATPANGWRSGSRMKPGSVRRGP
jgi:transposase